MSDRHVRGASRPKRNDADTCRASALGSAEAPRPRSPLPLQLQSVLREPFPEGRVAFLCAETGMNKTGLARRVLGEWDAAGLGGRYHSLMGQTSAQATRFLRALAHADGPATDADARLLVLDDVPAPDECDLDRQTRALASLAARGRTVIVCLRPEAEQLAEEMPGALRLHSQDLLAHAAPDQEEGILRHTHGIPALVSAACDASDPLEEAGFRSTLAGLVETHLRRSVPAEELRLRLAMLLLGVGDSEELASIVERMDVDALAWVHRDAPLFGADPMAGTFSCAGVDRSAGLEACLGALRPACEQEPRTVARCARTLAHRGDLRRAVLVCGLCQQEDFVDIACEWGVEFVCVGEDALVRRALSLRAADGTRPMGSQAAELALSVLSDTTGAMARFPSTVLPRNSSEVVRRRRRHLELLQACRDVDRGVEPGRVVLAREDDDALSRQFVDHLAVRRMLMDGRMLDAYELVLNNAARLRPDTLPAALLCDDFEIAELLLGEEPTPEERGAFRRARALICRMQSGRLGGYRAALEPALAVLAGRSSHAELEPAILRAQRMGDDAVRAMLLLVAAVADNRAHAHARAHVRARTVRSLVGAAATPYLADAAQLVDALACAGLGDMTRLRSLARAGGTGVSHDLATLATTEAVGDDRRVELTVLQRASVPRDDLWMLNVLCNDCDLLSSTFRGNAPRLWTTHSRRAVRQAEALGRQAERGQAGEQGLGGPQEGQPFADVRETSARPIELRLLGGFEARVAGQSVIGALERRRAKQLLALLGGAKGHRVARFEIVDSLWPGHEPGSATQRAYEATSLLRRVLREAGVPHDVIVTNRGDSSLSLDMTAVSCDVDDFERVARRALAGDGMDDEAVVRLACEAAATYVGELFVSQHDARGIVAKHRDELRELFVDVAVAGAGGALALGQATLAMRLARRATEADGMREDAAYLLVEALKLSGRPIDAWDAYQGYAQRLLEAASMPPSRAMRRLVADVAPSRARGGRQRHRAAVE